MAMLCLSISSSAYDFEVDGIAYDILSFTELTCQVAKRTYSGDIIIPAEVTYNGKTLQVESLADDCFIECANLRSVVLPNAVTRLGDRCFYGCKALENITLPQNLKCIDGRRFDNYGCFNGCASLTSISLPSTLTYIGDFAFANCAKLESVNLPEAVTVGVACFKNCSSLKTLPCIQMSEWPDRLFTGCRGLEYVYIPEGVSSLGRHCFSGCVNLSDIIVPASLTSVGTQCFSGTAIKDIKLHNLTSIPAGLFYGCKNLQSFEIAESVGRIEVAVLDWGIGIGAKTTVHTPTFGKVPLRKLIVRGTNSSNAAQAGLFRGDRLYEISGWDGGVTKEMLDSSWCKSLVYLELDRPVNGKLIDCPHLKTLIVNYELQSMDEIIQQRMSQLDKLETLQISSIIPPTISEATFSRAQYMDLTVVVPDDAIGNYREAEVWKNFWNLTSKSDHEAGVDKVLSDGKTEVARYDLMGNPLKPDYQGMAIIKYSDGTASKRVIR